LTTSLWSGYLGRHRGARITTFITEMTALLSRTPEVLRTVLTGEQTDWLKRTQRILEQGPVGDRRLGDQSASMQG